MKRLAGLCLGAILTLASSDSPGQEACLPQCAPTPPFPELGGCLWDRPKLTGDWWCARTGMLERGMAWDIDHTVFGFGVASGGVDRRATLAGHGDYVLNWDLGRAGVQEGLFLKLRAEHRYGESISPFDGGFLPATLITDLPTPASEEIYLTNVLFTQFLSESFGVFAGKLDTLDGDINAYAHGRGKTQFSNLGFIVNPLMLRAVPYSSLGAGFVVLHDMQPVFQFTAVNPTDTTRTSGFDELFAEGVTLAAEGRLPYEFAGMSGRQVMGAVWSSREYVTLGQDPRIILPDVPINRQDGTWALYWNMDQQLYEYECAQGAGWGMFARASIGDDQTNPMAYFLSAGVGGNSPLACRHQDTFGIGYYYLATSDEVGVFLQAALGPIGDGQGVEIFYNYAVAPWCHLTADAQVLVPEVEANDTALVLGLRAKIDF